MRSTPSGFERHLPHPALIEDEHVTPDVWKCRLPSSGEVIALVRTEAEVGQVRGMLVFTLAEVAIAIEAFGTATLEAKRVFPGATVTAVRDRSQESRGQPPIKKQESKQTATTPRAKPLLPSGSYQSLSKTMPPNTRYKGESFPVSNPKARYEEHMAKQRAAAAVAEGE